MILVTTKIEVRRPTKQKELVQTVSALAEQVRKEAGCLSSRLYCDVESERALCLLEEWATEAELEAHLRSDNYRVLRGAVKALNAHAEMKVYASSEPPERLQ